MCGMSFLELYTKKSTIEQYISLRCEAFLIAPCINLAFCISFYIYALVDVGTFTRQIGNEVSFNSTFEALLFFVDKCAHFTVHSHSFRLS